MMDGYFELLPMTREEYDAIHLAEAQYAADDRMDTLFGIPVILETPDDSPHQDDDHSAVVLEAETDDGEPDRQ